MPELTPRETEILVLFSKDHTCQQVADLLGVSKRTIEQHTHKIRKAMEVNSCLGACCLALREGIIK